MATGKPPGVWVAPGPHSVVCCRGEEACLCVLCRSVILEAAVSCSCFPAMLPTSPSFLSLAEGQPELSSTEALALLSGKTLLLAPGELQLLSAGP